jgi:hypothetical protein
MLGAAVFVVDVALGFGNVAAQDISAPSPYYPLIVGNCWTFSDGTGTRTERIVWKNGNNFIFDRLHSRTQVEVTSGSQFSAVVNGKNYLWCDFAAELNKSWEAYEPGDTVASFTATLESRTDTITVPAGTFYDVYRFHFKFHGSDNDWVEYYAPAVGPVRRVLYGFGIISYDLISWTNNDTLPARHIGDCSKTDGADGNNASPSKEMLSIFPNPSSSAVSISYRIADASAHIRISIFDLMGREVRNVVDGTATVGEHSTILDAGDLPDGVYYCRMFSGTTSLSRTLILCR